MHNLLTVGSLQWEYTILAPGNVPLLVFPGFGRMAEEFELLASAWSGTYQVVAINLFHHGQSTFPKERLPHHPLTKKELQDLTRALLHELKAEQFALAGYSLGGKLALTLYEEFTDHVQALWLLAPDGVHKNPWYHVASNTRWGRTIYSKSLQSPNWFFRLIEVAHKARLVNDKVKKFAIHNMNSLEKRQFVQKVWLTYRHTNPSMNKVIPLIRNHDTPVFQAYGKYDAIIRPRFGVRFAQRIQQTKRLHIAETGHQLIQPRIADWIGRQTEIKKGIVIRCLFSNMLCV